MYETPLTPMSSNEMKIMKDEHYIFYPILMVAGVFMWLLVAPSSPLLLLMIEGVGLLCWGMEYLLKEK